MTNIENKVLFSLKNFHYALHKAEPDGSIAFEKPVPVPGMVNIALAQVGEMVKFYADGRVFYQSSNNGGYEGDIELARIIDKMKEEIWGMKKTATDNVLIENINDEQKSFAALFEIEGDQRGERYCLYNCSASRPGLEAETSKETKEPKPQKLKISAVALPDGNVMASTVVETSDEVRKNWFEAVYVPGGAHAGVQVTKEEASVEKVPKE